MRLVRYACVFLLLTLWSVAKEHCALEAAGWLPEGCAWDCGESSGQDDACDLVEHGPYRPSLDVLTVAVPALSTELVVVPKPRDSAPPRLAEPARQARSLVRIRTWHFVERAAPPCRAPSLNV
jgi:hypothetical protein